MDIAVTPAIVKINSRSDVSSRGRTAAMAIAADAPQMAVAPPVRMPIRRESPSLRASADPMMIVATTAATISPPLYQPRPPI